MDRRMKKIQKSNFNSRKCINSHALLKEIEKHQVLYNRKHPKFSSKSAKQLVWNDISQALFPEYHLCNVKMKQTIRNAVNRRWKTLRDGLVRALKEIELKPDRLNTPQMKAMTFLIPHMTHGSNYSSISEPEPNATGNGMIMVKIPYNETQYESKPSDTESFGDISHEGYSNNKNCNESEDDIVSAISGEDMDFEDFTTAEADNTDGLKIAEIQSTHDEPEPLVKQEIDENISVHSDHEIQPTELNESHVSEMADNTVLQRSCNGNEVTVNSDIFELLQKSTLDSQDEDRMFLLSLLSDFKRILPENRLKIKLKIVQALADGQ